MEPLISICIPNHNYENYIKETIDSILAQTYQNFEIIVIDDKSTDKSVEIVKSYSDPRIKLYENDINLYTFRTNNKAMSLAKGELITILHSDDKYAPNFLEEIVKSYNKYPQHKVFITGVYFYHSEDDKLTPWHPYKSGGVKSQKEVLIRLYHQNNIGNGVNVVIHRDCLKTVGVFSSEYKYIADYDYLLRLANRYEFVYIPEMLTYYRVHNANATSVNIKQSDRDEEARKIMRNNFLDNENIPKSLQNKLSYIATSNEIHKAFYMGTRYKSGDLTRFILNNKRILDPEIIAEPYWHLIYLHSFLINEKLPKYWLQIASRLGRIILYPNKIYVNQLIERLIKQA
ncbi:MAG: Glycosyl transferase, family 2 [uncultured bacterium]|nr:MAG: Glycosyl transferase, family 2 [uncultured bacterium]